MKHDKKEDDLGHKEGLVSPEAERVGEGAVAVVLGDVLRYLGAEYHCREGWAVVAEHGIFDTFWGCGGSDRHRLTGDEILTAEVVFNLGDYRCVTYEPEGKEWADYHPNDRQYVPSQHGLQRDLYIRPGATPHLGTRIENTRKKVEECESQLACAKHRLEWARADLARLVSYNQEET